MKSMSISRQFAVLVGAFTFTMAAALGVMSFLLSQNAASSRRLAAEGGRQTDVLFTVINAVSKAQGMTQRMVREKDPDQIEALMAQAKASSKEAQDAIHQTAWEGTEVAASFDAMARANDKSIQSLLLGDNAAAQTQLIEESNPAYERLIAAIGVTQQAASRNAAAAIVKAQSDSKRAQILIYVAAGGVLFTLLLFAGWVVRHVNGTLCQAVEALSENAEGTASAATQVASSSQSLAQGSSQQAASLEEVSASAEEISSMTQKNADHSKDATEKMSVAAKQIGEANERLAEMMVSMNEIDASSEKVSKIIRTIDEIAFQTNILALNAAVEAARAGEAGLGFAVVADEVRNLAQRCSDAARDTASLIEESIGKTKSGKTKLDLMAETIQSVTGSAGSVKVLVDEIYTASQEQSRGIRQVSAALSQMEQVTQRNAAGAEEGAAAAAELSAQSKAMKTTIADLAVLANQRRG